MISIHTFELTLELGRSDFQRCLHNAYKMAKGRHRLGNSTQKKNVKVDSCYAENGITFEYHDNEFKCKIKAIINPSKVLGKDDLELWNPKRKNVRRVIDELEYYFDDYFHSGYQVNDFKLTRIEFTVNLNVGREKVRAYIRMLHRIGKVKKYSPKYSKSEIALKEIDKDLSFDMKGNSNDIEFTAYDKAADLQKKGKDKRAEKADGILRIEVRLKSRTAVKEALKSITESDLITEEEIEVLSVNSSDIFMQHFVEIIPFGDCYKLKEAEELIDRADIKWNRKDKMLRLLRLVPEKKSLYLALKEMGLRKPQSIVEQFEKVNISPITIGKREKVGHLKNLYEMLM